jgi:hypothetical protein
MLEPVEVRAVIAFGLGARLVRPGETITVSGARASYLQFLGIVKWL